MSNNDIKYTVEDGFRVLESRLEILSSDRAVISTRQAEIEKYLGRYIDKFVAVLTGGYMRATMIAPLKDNRINLHILFQQQHSKKFSPDDLLEKLYITLIKQYPDTVKNTRNKSVAVTFPELTFKIVPGFICDDDSYLVPNIESSRPLDLASDFGLDLVSDSAWCRVDYSISQQLIENENRKHSGYLIPVIKMMKCWNRSHGDYFDPYCLELMVQHLLAEVKISSYDQAIRHIFNKAKTNVVFTAQDPARNDAMIEGLRDVKALVDAMLHFQDAYVISRDAYNFESKGRVNSAYSEWGSLFPGFFPTSMEMVIQQIEASGVSGARALEMMRDSLS